MKLPGHRGTVVYGPYPPLAGEAAAATLDDVRRLLAAGADVRVVSPAPSAAHDDADLRRPAGAWRFARRALGAERLVVRLDAALLTSPANRDQLPARLALAAALRSAGRSTVHVPGGSLTVPPAWSRVLAAADEIVAGDRPAGSPAGAAGVAGSRPGAAGGGAGVAPGQADPGGSRPGWDLPPDPTREDLEAEIARRAAQHRAVTRPATGSSAADAASSARSTLALRGLPFLGPEAPRSARLVPHLVKQVMSRLVDWRINPVIEHVNVLHRAVLEAVEPSPPPAAGGGRPTGGPPPDGH